MRGGLRGDHGRGCAACGEVSASGDCELEDAMGEGGFGAGGSALGEAGVDGGFGAGVGEEQVLDDLLDAPLGGWEVGWSWVWVASRPWREEAISRWSWWRVEFIVAELRYTAYRRGG